MRDEGGDIPFHNPDGTVPLWGGSDRGVILGLAVRMTLLTVGVLGIAGAVALFGGQSQQSAETKRATEAFNAAGYKVESFVGFNPDREENRVTFNVSKDGQQYIGVAHCISAAPKCTIGAMRKI